MPTLIASTEKKAIKQEMLWQNRIALSISNRRKKKKGVDGKSLGFCLKNLAYVKKRKNTDKNLKKQKQAHCRQEKKVALWK